MAVDSQPEANHTKGSEGPSQVGGELPFWSAGKSGSRSHKMDSSTHPLLGSSPIIPALLFLVLVTLLISSAEYRHWSGSAREIPIAREVLAYIRSHGSPVPQDDVKVWTKQQFGFYYCQGDVLFGRKPGKMMTQSEALRSGYRPVHEQYCTNDTPQKESMRSSPPRKPVKAR